MEENLNQNIVPPTEPVLETPTPPVNQPPFGSWWKVGILVVGVLLAGSITYTGYQYSQKQTPSTPQPTPTPVVVTTPTPDPTANWKTYINTKYGYQFKYPPTWNFRVTVNNPESAPLYVIREGVTSDIKEWSMSVSIDTWNNPENLSLVDWLQFQKNATALVLPTKEKQLVANYLIGKTEAFRTWSDPLSNGEEPGKCYQACPILDIYFIHKDKAYRAQLAYGKEVDEESQRIFNQILSTFKFTQ